MGIIKITIEWNAETGFEDVRVEGKTVASLKSAFTAHAYAQAISKALEVLKIESTIERKIKL